MKFITKNQLLFALALTIITIAFRYGLSTLLEMEKFSIIWYFAALYGLVIFIFGWIFGKRDHLSLPIYDIGFRFHLTTYIICNAIAEVWFLAGLNSSHEKIKAIHISMVIWGVFLLLHFFVFMYTRKNAIKGIEKTEIFD